MSDNENYEKIHFATISDEVFKSLPSELILQFKSVRSDRIDDEFFKDDNMFESLKKNYYKAKKDFEDYKFDKRHNYKKPLTKI